jgi:hypothetical protein
MGGMTKVLSSVLGCAAVVAGFGVSADARAQQTQSISESIGATAYPTAFVARPINLRGGMVRLDARFQHLEIEGDPYDFASNQLAFGFGVGLTDAVEIGITHARPQGIDYYSTGGVVVDVHRERSGSSGDRFGDVALYGRYRFLDSEGFQLSGEMRVVLPVHSYSDWQFSFGVPLRARLGERFALDMAPEIQLSFDSDDDGAGSIDFPYDAGDGTETHIALNIPIAGVLQPMSNWWVAARSGMFWQDFGLDDFHFPLLLETGITLDHAGRAIGDLSIQGGFPYLFVPGSDSDTVVTELWTIRVNLTGYLAF